MDFLAWGKEFGFPVLAAVVLAWYIYHRDRIGQKKDEAIQKILGDQVNDAREDSAKNVDAFLLAIKEHNGILRETFENFGHLRTQGNALHAQGNEHTGSLGRIENHLIRDRERGK